MDNECGVTARQWFRNNRKHVHKLPPGAWPTACACGQCEHHTWCRACSFADGLLLVCVWFVFGLMLVVVLVCARVRKGWWWGGGRGRGR